MKFLSGRKTYIGAAVIFIAGGLHALNVIDSNTFQTILAIGGAISVYGLRKAIE